MTPPEQPESDNPDREPAESGASETESAQASTESQQAEDQAEQAHSEAEGTESTAEHADVRAQEEATEQAEQAGDSQQAESQAVPAESQSSDAESKSDEQASDAEQGESTSSEQAGQEGEQQAGKPKRKKTGLLIGVAAALVLVLGGGAALFFVFAGGASAQSVAEDYAALSDREAHQPKNVTTEDYRPLICQKAMPQIEQLQQAKQKFLKGATPQQLDQLKQIKTNVKDVQENGDSAQATFESTAPNQKPQTSKLNLIKEDGDWKLCTG